MLLRRITEHVRAQNWTAVGLDFFIVVVGVLLAFQINAWNEARGVMADEREFLFHVRGDILQDASEMRARTDYLKNISAAGARVISFLDEDRQCEDECWAILTDYFQASQWQDMSPNRVTYDEIQRTGFPSNPELKKRITGYYTLFEQIIVVAAPPRYRELVRSYIPSDAQGQFWRVCHDIRPREQKIVDDCPPVLSDSKARDVIEQLRAHPDMRPTLVFWMSTLVGVIDVTEVQIIEAEAIAADINVELNIAE